MLEVQTTPGGGRIVLAFDEASYPRDAVYAAAFAFIDRCWVHLERVAGGRLEVALRAKAAGADVDAMARELKEELLGQAWRQKIVEDGRAIVEDVAASAFGAPAADAGALDELLAEDGGAFDDPLGIATSWEEKYAKKGETPGGAA